MVNAEADFLAGFRWWNSVESRIKRFTVPGRERGDSSTLHSLQKYLDRKLRWARVRDRVQCVEAEEKPHIRLSQNVTKYGIDLCLKGPWYRSEGPSPYPRNLKKLLMSNFKLHWTSMRAFNSPCWTTSMRASLKRRKVTSESL